MNKELEALYKLNEIASGSLSVKENRYDLYDIIKSALERLEKAETENIELKIKNEKLEQAMKLIDEKQVSWGLIIRCQSVEEYNKWTHDYCITQEEYDFLRTFVQKEMLGEK